MILYGASGHGKVVLDILQSRNLKINQVIDDNPEIENFQGFSVELPAEIAGNSEVVLAIGNNKIRQKLSRKLSVNFSRALIHTKAHISENIQIGDGSVVMAMAVIHPDVQIGNHSIINTGAIVEHDAVLGDFVHISPGAVVTGNAKIGEGTHIGAGATLIPDVKIGKWATIGAGAVIISDVPDYAVVVGNPGKIIKFNKTENE